MTNIQLQTYFKDITYLNLALVFEFKRTTLGQVKFGFKCSMFDLHVFRSTDWLLQSFWQNENLSGSEAPETHFLSFMFKDNKEKDIEKH